MWLFNKLKAQKLKIKQLENALVNVRLNDGTEWIELKNENRICYEKIVKLNKKLEITTINRDIAIEQRLADWQRIKDLEQRESDLCEQIGLQFTQNDLGQSKFQIERAKFEDENQKLTIRILEVEKERDYYENYSYYVGTEIICNRIPLKYYSWMSKKGSI